jgi:hypothetical protein
MERTPVDSRAIRSVGYDAQAQELELEFRGGRVYRYRGVPRDVHQFLLRTPDKGSYVNRVIAKSFSYSERDEHDQHEEQADEPDLHAALEASLRKLRER